MAVGGLRRFAAGAPAPIYAAIGPNARRAVEDLSLEADISLQMSARHASLLLVAGEVFEEDRADLRRLHDQLPHPRATLWWRAKPSPNDVGQTIGVDTDLCDLLRSTHEQLLLGVKESEDDLLPDEPPAPWRGRGDHGQGGEGMMGGKPYGRPMAMTDEDLRDGLSLDAYTTSVGPFLPMFPPGLKLEVTLQGDVIEKAKIQRAPFLDGSSRDEPLRLIARLLRMLGLAAQEERFIRADRDLEQGRSPDMRILKRLLDWSGAVAAIPPGLGEIGSGDVRSRLHGWWEQIEGKTAASERQVDRRASAEDQHAICHLTDLLPGLEWHEAMLVINSFDAETLATMCPVAAPKSEVQGEQA